MTRFLGASHAPSPRAVVWPSPLPELTMLTAIAPLHACVCVGSGNLQSHTLRPVSRDGVWATGDVSLRTGHDKDTPSQQGHLWRRDTCPPSRASTVAVASPARVSTLPPHPTHGSNRERARARVRRSGNGTGDAAIGRPHTRQTHGVQTGVQEARGAVRSRPLLCPSVVLSPGAVGAVPPSRPLPSSACESASDSNVRRSTSNRENAKQSRLRKKHWIGMLEARGRRLEQEVAVLTAALRAPTDPAVGPLFGAWFGTDRLWPAFRAAAARGMPEVNKVTADSRARALPAREAEALKRVTAEDVELLQGVAASPGAFALLNRAQHIVYASAAIGRLVGMEPETLVGRKLASTLYVRARVQSGAAMW